MAKTLNVKRVTSKELENHWGFCSPFANQTMFVRCDAKGNVNWDKAPVYTQSELSRVARPVVEVNEKPTKSL